MRTIILTERQIKRVIDKIISEQNTGEFQGSTNANPISHANLSKFGLQQGSKYETFYYTAKIEDIIKASSGDESQFLSVFKPDESYLPDIKNDPKYKGKTYFDYFEVNDDFVNLGESKTFDFYRGTVYAAHNGLLAMKRAMKFMGGSGGKLTITLGSATGSGEEAAAQRIESGVKLTTDAFNLVPNTNSVTNILTLLSIQKYFRDRINKQAVYYAQFDDETLIKFLKSFIDEYQTGRNRFINYSDVSKILPYLQKKEGWISKVDIDIDGLVSKLINLQSIEDLSFESNVRGTYSDEKQKYLANLNEEFVNMMMKCFEVYKNNLRIFVQTYLPNSAAGIIPKIENVRFYGEDGLNLSKEHWSVFHSSYAGQTGVVQPTLNKRENKPKEGQ